MFSLPRANEWKTGVGGQVLSFEFILVGVGVLLSPSPGTLGEIQAVGVGKDW